MSLGRLLQLLGMAEVGVGLVVGIGLGGSMWVELIFLIIGVTLFTLGYYLDKRRRR